MEDSVPKNVGNRNMKADILRDIDLLIYYYSNYPVHVEPQEEAFARDVMLNLENQIADIKEDYPQFYHKVIHQEVAINKFSSSIESNDGELFLEHLYDIKKNLDFIRTFERENNAVIQMDVVPLTMLVFPLILKIPRDVKMPFGVFPSETSYNPPKEWVVRDTDFVKASITHKDPDAERGMIDRVISSKELPKKKLIDDIVEAEFAEREAIQTDVDIPPDASFDY
jgi:hypothetical protein